MLKKIIDKVILENRTVLFEHEVYEILKHYGINTPNYVLVENIDQIKQDLLKSKDVVVKVVSKDILHKTELGAVKFCKNEVLEITEAINSIKKNTKNYDVKGFLIVEKVDFKSFLGSELIFSIRQSDDFSYIINFGLGGINTEYFGTNLQNSFSIFSSLLLEEGLSSLKTNDIFKKITGQNREKLEYINEKDILNIINAFTRLKNDISLTYKEIELDECEVNPFVISNKKLIPLDGILKIKNKSILNKSEKPLNKLVNLLKPKSVCIAGVSSKTMNMGRIILNNIIYNGFDKNSLRILKTEDESIDGVKCVSSVSLLEKKFDLFVLAINASSSVTMIKEIVKHNKAESIILIPGGFAETSSGEFLEKEIVDTLNSSTDRPIIVGGNCLGVISYPGGYDTFFIPKNKITYHQAKPYAFISQSGAFVISKLSKTDLTPLYAISIGNQMDLYVSDYLDYFINNDEINILALYIEGFKPYDGIKTAEKIKKIISSGKKVIIYKAGRSSIGKTAASGHTASIAGDYKVFENIFKQVGATIANSFSEFEALLKIATSFNLNKKNINVGVLSNAGFETVGIADNMSSIVQFSESTNKTILNVLSEHKIDKLVSIHNPLDITPVANDEAYYKCFEAILSDSSIDFGIISCIPMTGAIKSIKEEIDKDSIFSKLDSLYEKTKKPFVLIVDSGVLYDYACSIVKKVPVFRETDTAIKAILKYFN